MDILGRKSKVYEFSKKMKNFIPMIITDGFILGFIESTSMHFLPKDHYSKTSVGVYLIFLGIGAILGGYLSGLWSDKYPIMKVGKSSFLVISVCMLLSIPVSMGLVTSFIYSCFLGFSLGFAWHYMDGWLWVTCSKIFEGKLEAFALNRLIHSISFVVYQIVLIVCGSNGTVHFIRNLFIILIGLMIISLHCITKEEKSKNEAESPIELLEIKFLNIK